MLKKSIFILFIVFIAAFLSAVEQPRITVMEFLHPPAISPEDALSYTRLFEGALINTGAFRVIRYDNVATILKAQAFSLGDFADPEMAVKVGQLVAADHIVTGEILTVEDSWALNIQLVNIETGQIIKTASGMFPTRNQILAELPGLAGELSTAGFKKPEIPMDQKIAVYVKMGDKYFSEREFDKAVAQYDKALEKDEWNPELLTRKLTAWLESFLTRSLYHGESISNGMDPALRNDFPFIHYIPAEELDAAQEILDLIRTLDEERAGDINLLMLEVQLNKSGSRAEKALKAVEAAYKIAPDNSAVLAELGLLSAVRDYKEQDISASLDMIRRAITMEPEIPLYHLYLGRSLERKGPHADSLREYRLAAELSTNEDFKTKRIRAFALQSLQRALYKLGGGKEGLLSPVIDMPPEERLDHLRFILDNDVPFWSTTGTQNKEYFLATLLLATDRDIEAADGLKKFFTEFTSPWQYRRDLLLLYKKILEKSKHDPETLKKINAALQE